MEDFNTINLDKRISDYTLRMEEARAANNMLEVFRLKDEIKYTQSQKSTYIAQMVAKEKDNESRSTNANDANA